MSCSQESLATEARGKEGCTLMMVGRTKRISRGNYQKVRVEEERQKNEYKSENTCYKNL